MYYNNGSSANRAENTCEVYMEDDKKKRVIHVFKKKAKKGYGPKAPTNYEPLRITSATPSRAQKAAQAKELADLVKEAEANGLKIERLKPSWESAEPRSGVQPLWRPTR
jgi:hypothetical protein